MVGMTDITEPTDAATPFIDIVLPVLDEQDALEVGVTTLIAYLTTFCPYRWQIIIADNGSTDRTWDLATSLVARHGTVHAIQLHARGRGLALRTAWTESTGDILAYMDIDLSTDLAAFMPLVAPLVSGAAQIATGSRLLPLATVTRSFRRALLSRGYNYLTHLLVPHRFSDAQCGFKALTQAAARDLLPDVVNNRWFFDTELLLLAEERGEHIHEIPVRWIEDPDSRVHIVKTVREDIAGLLRLRMQRWQRQFAHSTSHAPASPITR